MSILRGMVAEHWEGLYPAAEARARKGRQLRLAGGEDGGGRRGRSRRPRTSRSSRWSRMTGWSSSTSSLSAKMQKFPVALGPLIRVLRPHARRRGPPSKRCEARPTEEQRPRLRRSGRGCGAAAAARTPRRLLRRQRPPPSACRTIRAGAPAPPHPPTRRRRRDTRSEKARKRRCSRSSARPEGSRQRCARKRRADPRGYLCARLAMWGPIKAAPPDNAGKSALPPPPKTRLSEMQAMRSAGNNLGLLTSAESAFVTSPFWLDAQFIVVAIACRRSAREYDAARVAVVGQLGAFLARVPGLDQPLLQRRHAVRRRRDAGVDRQRGSGGVRRRRRRRLRAGQEEERGRPARPIGPGARRPRAADRLRREPVRRARALPRRLEIGEYLPALRAAAAAACRLLASLRADRRAARSRPMGARSSPWRSQACRGAASRTRMPSASSTRRRARSSGRASWRRSPSSTSSRRRS